MLAKPVRRDEQIKLIMECRRSGLTDFEWCRQHNIKVGTFYNWVKRLKQAEGITFPRGNKTDCAVFCQQEVVRLDVLQAPVPIPSANDQYNNSVAFNDRFETTSTHASLRVNLPYGTVEIPNGTNPDILEATLRILGGLYAR